MILGLWAHKGQGMTQDTIWGFHSETGDLNGDGSRASSLEEAALNTFQRRQDFRQAERDNSMEGDIPETSYTGLLATAFLLLVQP